MSHKNKLSLIGQAEKEYKSMFVPGESKHAAKATEDGISDKIFSVSTIKSYLKHACYFLDYCKEAHGTRDLQDCRQYVDEWLGTRADLSAYTVKLEAAALAKLYHCSTKDFIKTAPRRRADIKRSRGPAVRDRHFSEKNNKEIIAFCRSTGLRRRELQSLTGDKLRMIDGQLYLLVDKGTKGGKIRLAPVVGDIANVIDCMDRAGSGKVWPTVSTAMDVHNYRAQYATSVYKAHERTIEECLANTFYNPETGRTERHGLYIFRKDRRGECLDKAAMLEASRALGHNRISVVAEHYIRF